MKEPVEHKERSGRALLCNIGRIGDTIIRNSILDSVRNTYGHIGYICGKATASIMETDDRIDELFVFDNSIPGFKHLIRATLLQKHDCYIDLKDHDSNTSLMIATICRARLKVGCNRKSYRPFHRDISHTHGTMKKKLDVMRDIAAVAGLRKGNFQTKLNCSNDSREWFRKTYPNLQTYYFVNVSATAPPRIWPERHWVEFLSHEAMNGATALVSGLPEHASMVQGIVDQVSGAVAFRPRGLMDVVAAMERSFATFTVDTGITQVAAALQIPMVVLYGSREQAHEFSPGGEGNIFLSPNVNKQIETLPPDKVILTLVERNFLRHKSQSQV